MSNVIVIIATYNEAATIAGLLNALRAYPVIVVDDSSPDGTGDIARAYENVTVITRPGKLGIASAYLAGIKAALARNPEYVVQMDAGGTHVPADIQRLVVTAERYKLHLVLGYRAKTFKGYRTLISRGGTMLMRSIGVDVKDATCGFRCWRADLLREMDLDAIQTRGFAFQLEMLYQASCLVACLVGIPIEYRLTNSSFRWGMVWEALRTWARLAVQEWRRVNAHHTRPAHLQ